MVEVAHEGAPHMEIPALQEYIEAETESLENIFYDENVIVEPASVVAVPKHLLTAKAAEETKAKAESSSKGQTKPSLAQIRLQQHIAAQRNQDGDKEKRENGDQRGKGRGRGRGRGRGGKTHETTNDASQDGQPK